MNDYPLNFMNTVAGGNVSAVQRELTERKDFFSRLRQAGVSKSDLPFSQDILNRAFMIAVVYDQLKVAEVLFQYGAQVDVPNLETKQTALQIQTARGNRGFVNFLNEARAAQVGSLHIQNRKNNSGLRGPAF